MVSKASEDFPDPLKPVITVKVLRGISTSMLFRLCCRAPCTVMRLSLGREVSFSQRSIECGMERKTAARGIGDRMEAHRKGAVHAKATLDPDYRRAGVLDSGGQRRRRTVGRDQSLAQSLQDCSGSIGVHQLYHLAHARRQES